VLPWRSSVSLVFPWRSSVSLVLPWRSSVSLVLPWRSSVSLVLPWRSSVSFVLPWRSESKVSVPVGEPAEGSLYLPLVGMRLQLASDGITLELRDHCVVLLFSVALI
jgi:hypothetical protein